jgi:hypothetical protein
MGLSFSEGPEHPDLKVNSSTSKGESISLTTLLPKVPSWWREASLRGAHSHFSD